MRLGCSGVGAISSSTTGASGWDNRLGISGSKFNSSSISGVINPAGILPLALFLSFSSWSSSTFAPKISSLSSSSSLAVILMSKSKRSASAININAVGSIIIIIKSGLIIPSLNISKRRTCVIVITGTPLEIPVITAAYLASSVNKSHIYSEASWTFVISGAVS